MSIPGAHRYVHRHCELHRCREPFAADRAVPYGHVEVSLYLCPVRAYCTSGIKSLKGRRQTGSVGEEREIIKVFLLSQRERDREERKKNFLFEFQLSSFSLLSSCVMAFFPEKKTFF